MPREFFRKLMPSEERVNTERKLRVLRPLLNKPYLWHLNRHSCARAVAVGFFWSQVPLLVVPTVGTIWMAVKARSNVPIAFISTWISNPLTMAPHWWAAYVLGKFLLHSPSVEVHFTREFVRNTVSWGWVLKNFWTIFLPTFVGGVIEGIVLAALAYLVVDRLWKRHARKKWRLSRARAKALAEAGPKLELGHVISPPVVPADVR